MSENLASSGPRVNTHAPDLTLSTVSGLERRISHGEPRVLAFLQHRLGHEPPRELAAIRAELRGLGAELLVISPHGIWSVRADDPLEVVTGPAGDARITDAVQTAERYGVASGSDAVTVIDERGIVRFTHRLEGATGAVWTKLASALAIAGRAMLVRDRHDAKQRVLFTRREWTLTSLVIGCATAFLGGCNEAAIALDGAAPRTDNAFKIELGRRTVLRALQRGAS